MALIDGTYITALTESIPYEIDATENQVEEGIPLTDHTERKSLTISIECLILDLENGMNASDIFDKFKKIQDDARIVKFVGRNIFEGIITKIDKKDNYQVANGFNATITMKEIRIATSPFRADLMQAVINAGLQQLANQQNQPVYHTAVKGDCLINIAKKYGTTLDFILKHNKIKSGNPNLIYPGEKYLVKNGSGEYEQGVVTQSLRWISVAEELKKRTTQKTVTKTTNTEKVVLTSTNSDVGGGGTAGGSGSSGSF